MTIASDNPFPSLLIVEGTEPTAPAAGRQRLYIDSTTHLLKLTNSSGTDINVGAHELDYAQFTSPVTVSATSEATATTVVTGSSVAYDGSTVVMIEFYAAYVYINTNTATKGIYLWLYDGSSSIGRLSYHDNPTTADLYDGPVFAARRLTPSNASHTYSVRASKDSGGTTVMTVAGAAGGAGADMPGFIRITRV